MPTLPDYNPLDFEIALGIEDVKNHRFHSTPNPNKKPYTIVMPPPNVTGMLHIGHILNATIQDVLIRYKRMDGYEACWIPGLDHASIATETKVIQWLESQNIKKSEIGREKFLDYAMQWKEQYGGIINDQLKRLGVSCDWDRERFTMDKEYSQEVLQSFIDLFNAGLIYKGTRMVNWCPKSQSAISDDEVEHKEEQGYLWHFSYPIKDRNESIVIATTRPETMFGDTAVMVNPSDERYQHLIGQVVVLPFMNKDIPIIADDYVDPEFGTGAVKVTPAHDPNDYAVGLRHDLDMPIIMTEEGTLNNYVPEMFRGIERFEARKLVVEEMKKLGLLVSIKEHIHKVGYSQRGQAPIESMLSEQWFIAMKELAVEAKKSVNSGEIQFYPNHWVKTYNYWLDNIKDWCISRQLWWGHRIPIYTCECCHYQEASIHLISSCPKCKGNIVQDEDVLDTWASSWLWSYAVHRNDKDKNYYHPTDTLVTGPDIIFFWVARMIMAAKHFRKEIPFKHVYFTGLIRDDLGRKMSKTLGNSPNPLDIMAEYGADALRFSIIRLAPLGNDILYSSDKVDLGKRFANKLWNAARFVLMYAEQNSFDPKDLHDNILSYDLDDFDKSILTRFNHTVEKTRDYFDKFRVNDVAKEIYDFIWGDFCDKYIENSKTALNHEDIPIRIQKLQIILSLFKRILKLLHPIMPFVTEKLYREVFGSKELLFADYPITNQKEIFKQIDDQIKRLDQVVYLIREMRAESNVPPSSNLSGVISVSGDLQECFERNKLVIVKLARLSNLTIVDTGREVQKGEATALEYDFQIFINLADSIDKEKEIERLQKEQERLQKAEKSVNGKLSNPQFVQKAPVDVIIKEKAKLEEILNELDKVNKALMMWK